MIVFSLCSISRGWYNIEFWLPVFLWSALKPTAMLSGGAFCAMDGVAGSPKGPVTLLVPANAVKRSNIARKILSGIVRCCKPCEIKSAAGCHHM